MEGEGAREEWEEIRLPRNRNPETAERGGLQGEEGGAGAEATQAWLLLFLPVTLMIPGL